MPTDLSGQPLDALKQWLAISTAREDALLLRLLESAWRMCLRFTAIDADDWAMLPEPLRHGIIRFAAHHYRERGRPGGDHLPAAVAALWRPYRGLRL